MSSITESFVRITYTTPEHELTAQQMDARARFENSINQAMDNFHGETSDGLLEIKLYPCDDECQECQPAVV